MGFDVTAMDAHAGVEVPEGRLQFLRQGLPALWVTTGVFPDRIRVKIGARGNPSGCATPYGPRGRQTMSGGKPERHLKIGPRRVQHLQNNVILDLDPHRNRRKTLFHLYTMNRLPRDGQFD